MRTGARYRWATPDEIDVPKEFDDYVIGRELGQGVTGKVYLAEDALLARPVAIKVIANLDAGARQRFLFEARAVAKIHHPNVVGVYRGGTVGSRPYLASELVRGSPLAKLAKPMAAAVALDIAIGLARGLAAAHRHNVVHCDLKPSNVMIDSDGIAKIIDFGLARVAVEGSNPGHAPVGTPDYMAPEVWRGETPSPRADVYSLGAVLFELLAGAPPFADVAPAALRERVTTGDAPDLRERAPGVDLGLAEVVARCLSRDRQARFADGDALREALERLHASRRHTVRAGENPYRGLQPFEASHRGLFFGRRSEVDTVVARLRAESILLVTGDSGVGKSSLCRAGVVPAVLDGELGEAWQALTIVPGRHPLGALAAAIGAPDLVVRLRETPALLARELRRHAGDRKLLVFIDQFEELISQGDPAEVAALDAGFEALIDGVPGLRVLATVRADFLARISDLLPVIGRDLSRLLYFLRPLPPERMRDVILGPAAAVGARFESDAIVEELIQATAQAGSGGLPLLSFALADLWEARDVARNVIPSSAVAAMGGVAGALSRHAEVVIGAMIASDRDQARRILLRLVTAMGTRARQPARELAFAALAAPALDALVKGRLVVVRENEPESVYELAHDCLLTGWPTLRRWLDADTAGRAVRERLAAASAEWVRLGERSDVTWQGERLAEAVALDPEGLSTADRDFIAASRRVGRSRRRARWLAGFGVVALVMLTFSSQRYLVQREIAAQIDDELQLARVELVTAHRHERLREPLEAYALAAFDAGLRDLGEAAWKEVQSRGTKIEAAYRSALQSLDAAWAKDPKRSDVRDLLGDTLNARAQLADHVHDYSLRDEMLARLESFDAGGTRLAPWTVRGRVTVHAPAGAAISIEPGARALGNGTLERLPPGSYVITIAAHDRVEVRAAILVARGGSITVDVDPPRLGEVPSGFVYIPAGEFLFGHANESERATFFETTPLRPRRTGAFLIGANEVTFADWLTYVDSFPPAQRAARLPNLPDRVSGGIQLTPDGAGHWRIDINPLAHHYVAGWGEMIRYTDRANRVLQDWRRFPVTGVSADDATAYTAWLDRTDRVRGARLCSELEWERAARGADDRLYPGGRGEPDQDDINVDTTYSRELRSPDEVGSHPRSDSPFKLSDMSGNAIEWTVSETGGRILRGGGYWYDRKSAQVIGRTELDANVRDAPIGFRVCATPQLPH